MRNSPWLILAALGLDLISAGTSRVDAQVHLGAKGGVSLATLMGDDVAEVDWRTGFVGGGFLTYRLGERFALQPELLFAQKGARQEFVGNVLIADAEVELRYVEVPLLLKLLFPGGTSASSGPFLMAGPSIAFRTGCKAMARAPNVAFSIPCDDSQIDLDVKSTDLSVLVGGGVGFTIVSAMLSIEARYQRGLTSIDDSGADADVRNQSFAVMAGISVPLPGLMSVVGRRGAQWRLH